MAPFPDLFLFRPVVTMIGSIHEKLKCYPIIETLISAGVIIPKELLIICALSGGSCFALGINVN